MISPAEAEDEWHKILKHTLSDGRRSEEAALGRLTEECTLVACKLTRSRMRPPLHRPRHDKTCYSQPVDQMLSAYPG